jgi:hypothetical protein
MTRHREPFDSFMAGMFAQKAIRGERARELAAEGKSLYSFQTPYGKIAVHASTRKPGTWQVTRFLPDGTPTGHSESPTCVEALRLAASDWQADIGAPASTKGARRAARRTARVPLIVAREGDRPHKTTLEEFLIDNADDAESCQIVRMLAPGATATLGGGAVPLVTVKKLRTLKRKRS